MDDLMTRREFAGRIGLATGLGALGGVWTEGAQAQSKSPNSVLHVAVIGAGGKGASDISDVIREPGVRIVAMCDPDAARAADWFKKLPDVPKYSDYRKMFDMAGKGIDAVTVSIPDHSHAAATAWALHHGKGVYCQKPLTHTVWEARKITELAARAKVATQMGTQGHAFEGYFRLVEIIQSGAIGAVHEVHVWTDRPGELWPQGLTRPTETQPVPTTLDWDSWLGPAAERPYHSSYLPFVWRGWWDFGTGALGDMACHLMDPVFWALKLTAPTRVVANAEGMTADSPPLKSAIRYEFPQRGELPPVTMLWYDGGNRPPSDIFGGETVPQIDNGSLFVGSKGKLLINHGDLPILLPKAQFADYKPPEPTLKRSPGHHREWLEACRSGGPTGSNFGYAGPMTEAILLGNVAIRAGQPIEWDSKRLRVTNDADANRFLHTKYRKGYRI